MKKVEIGKLCTVLAGGDKPKIFSKKANTNVNIPVYANGIEDEGLVGYTNIASINSKAVTISARGTTGIPFYRESPYVPIIRLISIIPKESSKLDCKYLYYLLKARNLSGNGSVQAQLTVPMVEQTELQIIENTTLQRKISNILWGFDEKIANNNAISIQLESLAKTIYDYWFLQFEFPDEEGKPYKSSGGKMVWNDELKREIPEGWEVTSLRGKYNIERGISYTSKDIESGKGLPMLNLACVDTSRNYRDGELKYTTGCVTESEKLHGGELLIACTDLTRNADIVGCPILVPQDGKTYTYSMDLAKIYSTASSLTNMYLYQSLRTDCYHRYIKKWASGTNVLHLNLDGLNWYSMALPPVLLQKKYASLMSAIEKKKSDILVENRQLTSLRDFLLPLLMNGQVTFKEDA